MPPGERPKDSKDALEARYGPWTAMSIRLGDGEYTLEPPTADPRLKRFVQVVADIAGQAIHQLRILDLACLEGHYAIEFAMQGARVVGIEIREPNFRKAQYAKQRLGLHNLELYQDDVRSLTAEKYGSFDVVICSGILYHLDSPDVFEFVRQIHDVCTRLLIVDTYIALEGRVSQTYRGVEYWGLYYTEHGNDVDEAAKARNLWASIDNVRSFWFTRSSLINLLTDVGFTSVYDVFSPPCLPERKDRITYMAIKGTPAPIVSSEPTHRLSRERWPERSRRIVGLANVKQSRLRLFVKATFPQPAKDVIKKVLRRVGLMEPDRTPAFMKARLTRDPGRVKGDDADGSNRA